MTKKNKLKDTLEELEDITKWFEEQKDIDVEEGLEKVKKAAVLIKDSKSKLKDIENEFDAVKSDIQAEK